MSVSLSKVGAPRGGARLVSELPEIIRELPDRGSLLAHMLANETAKLAIPNAPVETGALKRSIEGKRLPRGDAAVMAAWYWFFSEFGTVKQPPHPFMVPAFEMARAGLPALAKEAFANLS